MFTEVDYKILELVLQSPEPVPSRQLALVCDVSINTIRTEIDLLNQELAAHGVCIRMKRSSGTSLEVLNEALARPWMHQMRDMLIRNKRLQRKYSERVYSLTRTILCAPDGITVERLVQVFYVSRGTILAAMDLWCRAASGISGSACCFCTRTTPLRPTAANLTC